MMLATLALALACSGSTKPVVQPEPEPPVDAGVVSTADSSPTPPGLSQEACEGVLEKVFALVFAHQTANLPPEAQPTPEDVQVA